MLNNLVLVGRISNEPKIKMFDDGTKVCNFDLAVDRPYKSQEGTREVDYFSIAVWQAYADAVFQYCGIGSIVGIKGRLMTHIQEIGGIKVKVVDIIGERVAFINVIHQKEKSDPHAVPDVEEVRDINEEFDKSNVKVKKKEEKDK